MSALLVRPDGVRATTCWAYGLHRPVPLRFIWHHLLPEVCGGATEKDNLVSLCDSCHLTVHALMWWMKVNGPDVSMVGLSGAAHRRYARMGYALAVEAGTVNLIPNEGSILHLA